MSLVLVAHARRVRPAGCGARRRRSRLDPSPRAPAQLAPSTTPSAAPPAPRRRNAAPTPSPVRAAAFPVTLTDDEGTAITLAGGAPEDRLADARP